MAGRATRSYPWHLSSAREMRMGSNMSAWHTIHKLRIIKTQMTQTRFAWPEDLLCPVASFKRYISKSDAKSFYLHPKHAVASDVWYSQEPMGAHYLENMWNKISEKGGSFAGQHIPQLRCGAGGWLSNAGLESHQIISVTGHRCEGSLQAYWAR
ncbi:uncharacterized protein LOC122879058 isoform X2 [Siniperca chuatsi]|uniref:uncharacterized protein LOC122879058 isoform X2 n=1 Tax=Siniperca chuatsi TaxID=119488 RepID=UPI001CE04FB8|nr:uncharacterized protein LOC122879058 isoform X2 [Siniperca chuatsi]